MSVHTDYAAQLRTAAQRVARTLQQRANLTARRVADAFFQSGFFAAAGYGFAEDDSRLEGLPTLPGYTLLIRSFTGAVIGLIQITAPGRMAGSAAGLEKLTSRLLGQLPAVAALTDGARLLLFSVKDGYLSQQIYDFDLAALSLEEAGMLAGHLSQCRVDWQRQLRHPHVPANALESRDTAASISDGKPH